MSYSNIRRNWVKFILAWGVCFAVRLIPLRPPNVEPILATSMPFSGKFGAWAGGMFAFFSIVIFDAMTGKVGLWTWITAGTYALVSMGASVYFRTRKRPVTGWTYMQYGIIGAIVFDLVTGSIGPLFYDQPFTEALIGQIPFTINHILGNIVLSLALSPLVERWIVMNRLLEHVQFVRRRYA